MKTIATKILAVLTRLTLMKFKPVIVGITGSVGKTSTREAVATALLPRFNLRASSKSYNNQYGLPFTVLGQESPGRNILSWIWLIIKSIVTLLGGNYPQVLVLEMGSDRPGDIEYLLKLTGRLDYAVVTDIGISHLMNYPSREALAKEKLSLLKGLKENGKGVLNYDNDAIANQVKDNRLSNYITYGLDQQSDVAASEIQLTSRNGVEGLTFKIKHKGTVVPVMLPDSFGRSNVYAALAASAVGLSMGMNLVEVAQSLIDYKSPPGRLKMIPGIKRTRIIDDTYNAAPASTNLALEVLSQVAKGRKVAVIGGMAELGAQNESGHSEVAAKIQEVGVSLVFLVGENAKIIKDELERRHFSGTVRWLETSDNARIPVQNEIQEGDTILVKGSQSARMERIVKEIMFDPELAEKLLVRQSAQWLSK
ncbi:MAG: UDP-N-acetylmuramoyl-tripeptide--D-alanyl-D-alanine ligase [Candidatus Doudnabacteria bacterium]|nr:UDP-N-acetylmuramoyl-tripeptide--D-alanyl-D-alanine ligase [Candidatus Doudnabacteria bacterium]